MKYTKEVASVKSIHLPVKHPKRVPPCKIEVWVVNTMVKSLFGKTMKWSHGHYGHFGKDGLVI